MREGSKKYTEGLLLKRKRRRAGEETGEEERLPGQDPEPPRIHLHINGFLPKQAESNNAGRRAPRFSLSFLRSNEGILSFARSLWLPGVCHHHMRLLACEESHFSERQGGALGKCGL